MHPGSGGNEQEPAGHEDSSAASPGMQVSSQAGSHCRPSSRGRFGETRRRRSGTTGGCERRGNPKLHCRERWRVRDSRRLGDPSAGVAEDPSAGVAEEAKIQGDLEIRRVGPAGRCGMRGDSEPHLKAERDDGWPDEPASSPYLRRQRLRSLAPLCFQGVARGYACSSTGALAERFQYHGRVELCFPRSQKRDLGHPEFCSHLNRKCF
jgi:hypothetical protein